MTRGHGAAPPRSRHLPRLNSLPSTRFILQMLFSLLERLSRGILEAPACLGWESKALVLGSLSGTIIPGEMGCGNVGHPLSSVTLREQHTIKTSEARWFISNYRAGSCHFSCSSSKASGTSPSQDVSHTLPGSRVGEVGLIWECSTLTPQQ